MVDGIEKSAAVPESDDPVAVRRAPWHLWAVGVLSALWNLTGVTDYTLSHLRNRAWLQGGAEHMGITVETMIAYIDGFPAWSHAFWALGVWGALLGSILLLMRRRYAVWAFAISLLGLAVTQFYRAFTPQPEWAQGDPSFNLLLWSIATFLLIYAVSMKNKDLLR